MVTPTNRQPGEYRAICLFESLKKEKKKGRDLQLCSHRQGIALLRVTRNDMTATALPVCALVQSCKSSEFCPALDLKRLHLQDMQCFQPYPSQPTSHVIPFSPKSIWSLSRSTSPLDCLFSAWFRTSKWSFSPIGIDPRHKIILTIK